MTAEERKKVSYYGGAYKKKINLPTYPIFSQHET
jgi:hypothetical protein